MSKTLTAGIVALYCDLKISVDEMREWEPERIKAFFEGVAIVQAAVRGPLCESQPDNPLAKQILEEAWR